MNCEAKHEVSISQYENMILAKYYSLKLYHNRQYNIKCIPSLVATCTYR